MAPWIVNVIRSSVLLLIVTQSACAQSNSMQLAMHSPAPRPATSHKLLIFDRFEYKVNREHDPDGYKTFKESGGWSHAKAVNLTGSHAGYLYTVNEIPGYTGPFPGKNSKTVLAMESRPGSFKTQTDFYLQYGHPYGSTETIPGHVWFQFWIYPNQYDANDDDQDQMSAFAGRFKFLYPCKNDYPCHEGNLHWLNMLGHTTGEPYWAKNRNTELFMTTVDPYNAGARYLNAPEWNQFKLGQTDVSEYMVPNRWTLVKIHYDTSTTSGRYEAWLKPMGGEWKKVSEWIDGYTRQFEWKIAADKVGGHSVLRIPTTMDHFDSWIYLDDFAMATSEKALPQY